VVYALSPVQVIKIYMDSEARIMDLVIPDDELERAVGPDGRHLQLAADLTGWTLNLYRESRMSELEVGP
jgi:transcription termination/antitermination protein NusA